MKNIYLSLIALVTLLLFASPAAAQVGHQWDKQINNPGRFKVLNDFGGAAVLDKETGLVWERSPGGTEETRGGRGPGGGLVIVEPPAQLPWHEAQFACNTLTKGGRKGWRLPTFQELASLLDPTVPFPGPALPPGHPFSNVQSSSYWSATTEAGFASNAWVVNLPSGGTGFGEKAAALHVWCVRGGQGVDAQ